MNPSVRVADVAAHAVLHDAALFGTAKPASTQVAGVDLVVPEAVLSAPLVARGAVVLALDSGGSGEYRDHLLDVLLRRCAASGSSVLVAVGARLPLSAATRRLAESVRVPVLVPVPGTSSIDVVIALRSLVETPNQFVSDVLLAVAQGLRHAPRQLDEIVDLLRAAIPAGNIYACSGRSLVLAGTPKLTSTAEVVAFETPSFIQRDDVGATVMPITGFDGEVSVWLVAERERPGRIWLDAARAALDLCAGPVLAWLTRQNSALDRDARLRAALLTEVLDHGQGISREVAEDAARAGWQLEGWHTGVHLRFRPSTPSALAVSTLVGKLRETGLKPSSFVERTDGWSAWLTSPREPTGDFTYSIANMIRRDLEPPSSGLTVAVGIGSPHRDVSGIAVTLAEARQAAVVASAGPSPVSVRVLQELGPARLLLGWYSSEAFAEYASQMLAPLFQADDPDLLATLEAYLERASSTAATARALGVHRNTVANRISKAERILQTSLVDGDTRLALQLALRMMRIHDS